jgi:hypothetical protein
MLRGKLHLASRKLLTNAQMALEVLGALETPRTVYTAISPCSRWVVALDLLTLDRVVTGVVTGVWRCHYGICGDLGRGMERMEKCYDSNYQNAKPVKFWFGL